jgi:hypothetical protein
VGQVLMRLAPALALLAALVDAGCDWRSFDDQA